MLRIKMQCDARNSLRWVDRLGTKLGCPGYNQIAHLVAINRSCLHQDGQINELGLGPHLPAYLLPAEIRQLHVEQQQIGPQRLNLLQSRMATVSRLQVGELTNQFISIFMFQAA